MSQRQLATNTRERFEIFLEAMITSTLRCRAVLFLCVVDVAQRFRRNKMYLSYEVHVGTRSLRTGSGPWTPAYKKAVGVDQLGTVSTLGRSNPLEESRPIATWTAPRQTLKMHYVPCGMRRTMPSAGSRFSVAPSQAA